MNTDARGCLSVRLQGTERWPNIGLEPTRNSLRSCLAAALVRGSGAALDGRDRCPSETACRVVSTKLSENMQKESVGMMLVSLHDKAEIEAFVRQNALLYLFELGDLDDFFWPSTVWYARKAEDTIQQLALLYIGV